MTRAGGVSANNSENAAEARGAKNRKGEPTDGVGAGGRINAGAGWSGGRLPPDGTARPANAEGKSAKPHERRLADLSAQNDGR